MRPNAFDHNSTLPVVHFSQRADGSYIPIPARIPVTVEVTHSEGYDCGDPYHNGDWVTVEAEVVGVGPMTARGHIVAHGSRMTLFVEQYYRR